MSKQKVSRGAKQKANQVPSHFLNYYFLRWYFLSYHFLDSLLLNHKYFQLPSRPDDGSTSSFRPLPFLLFALCFFVIYFNPGLAKAREQDRSLNPLPQHYIILIHGIGSSHKLFGSMGPVLEKNLNFNGALQKFTFVNFDYDTQNDQKSVEDFANDLESFLSSYFVQHPLLSQDRFSFVTHSQGGRIVLRWLLNRRKNFGPTIKPSLEQVDSIVTVAPPYWGSRMATFGKYLKNIFGNFWYLQRLGLRQLEDMAIASEASFRLQDELNDPKNELYFAGLSKNIRFLNIVGLLGPGNPLLKAIHYDDVFEGDLAVPTSSASYPHLFYRETAPPISTKVNADRFLHSKFAPETVYVDGAHLPRLEKILGRFAKYFSALNYPSESDVPPDCLNKPLEQCQSAAILPIFRHFQKQQQEPISSALGHFELDQYTVLVELRPMDPIKDVTLASYKQIAQLEKLFSAEFKNNQTSLSTIEELQEDRFTAPEEFRSWSTTPAIRKAYSGKISELKNGHVLQAHFSVAGYKARDVEIPVQAGTTTFTELVLSTLASRAPSSLSHKAR